MSGVLERPQVHLDERISRIHALDLEPIKFKLVDGDGEPGWSVQKADEVEVEYKRFLVLIAKNSQTRRVASIVPSRDVDKFWHTHILDTMKYPVDCEFCFGFFLHHFPYLGLRGPEDAQVLKDCAKETREFYKAEFGHYPVANQAASCNDVTDCAPEQSCSGEPPDKFANHARPVLARV